MQNVIRCIRPVLKGYDGSVDRNWHKAGTMYRDKSSLGIAICPIWSIILPRNGYFSRFLSMSDPSLCVAVHQLVRIRDDIVTLIK